MEELARVNTEVIAAMASVALLMLILGIMYKLRPPKSINNLYGYRTRRSMANDDIWKMANTHSANTFVKHGIALVVAATLLSAFKIPYAMLIFLAILLGGLAVSVVMTETHLNNHFDKNGNRKT